jgi:hypothetical protein
MRILAVRRRHLDLPRDPFAKIEARVRGTRLAADKLGV